MPPEVVEIVTTIRDRACIHLGHYTDVITTSSSCSTSTSSDGSNEGRHVLEQAYALYRLKKYRACSDVCSRYLQQTTANDTTKNDTIKRGMAHIQAQALYRQNCTLEADTIYSQLYHDNNDNTSDTTMIMDVDEREDLISNALANRIANYTPGSTTLFGDNRMEEKEVWVETVSEVKNLLQRYYNQETYNQGDRDTTMLQNYDLAYNLATYLLITADARSKSDLGLSARLLADAEASALTILEPTSTANDESKNDTEQDAIKKARAEKEALPIQINLAYAQLLQGGDTNEKEALRRYLTCIMGSSSQKKGAAKSNSSSVEGNLVATASNNLALLRDGKESVFDILKRIPDVSSGSVREDGGSVHNGKGNTGSSSSTVSSIPLTGATPQQIRTVLFNRALQYAKMGNVGGCLEALAVLRASLEISYRGDDESGDGRGNKKAPGSPKSKGKKKKGVNKSESSDISIERDDVPAAKPASEVETIAWNARADWVESELRRVVAAAASSDDKKPEDIINDAISYLDSAMKSNANDEAAGALSLMKAQLQLYNAAVTNGQTKPQPLISSLESLPPLIQSCPGTTVTLASLHGSVSKDDGTARGLEIMSSLGDGIPAQLALAEFHLERNQYDEAIKLLEGILDQKDLATTEQVMSATALVVQALSYSDPEKANDYAETLREACGEDTEMDGEELEAMEIPRFAKKAGEAAASSSKVRKMIASSGGKRGAGHR